MTSRKTRRNRSSIWRRRSGEEEKEREVLYVVEEKEYEEGEGKELAVEKLEYFKQIWMKLVKEII